MRKKITIQCSDNHVWDVTAGLIYHLKRWCPYCFQKNRNRLTINEMKDLAINRGGLCLSKKYVNNETKLKWSCSKGHIWTATPKSIKIKKRWCPQCNESKGEIKVLKYLNLKNLNFERQKSFNECKNKRPLKFDFYLPYHNICIEYDGEQHFKLTRFSNITIEKALNNLKYLLNNDNIKKEFCKEKNIKLIRIPYYMENIENFLDENITLLENNDT